MEAVAEANLTVSDVIAKLCRELEALPSSKRLSFADTEVIYGIAYNLVAQGRYADALRRFSVLTLYRPLEPKYLAGLAVCNQMLGRYDEASSAFAFAAHLQPDEPEHLLSIAECDLLRQNFGEARELLELVVRFCREKGGYDKTRLRAEGMLALTAKEGDSARI